jgi:hypothetical protein
MNAMSLAGSKTTSQRKQHLATRIAFMAICWAIAAIVVMTVQEHFGTVSAAVCVGLKSAVIIFAAMVYMKLVEPHASLDHAILVGMIWLVLAMFFEIGEASRLGRGWYELLGPPSQPVPRDIVLFVWLAAPALFARART